jgi:hypothetical protein
MCASLTDTKKNCSPSSSVSKLRRPIAMPLASLTMQGIPTVASANISDFLTPTSAAADQAGERVGSFGKKALSARRCSIFEPTPCQCSCFV